MSVSEQLPRTGLPNMPQMVVRGVDDLYTE